MNDKSQHLVVSGHSLKVLAAVFWYFGSFILLFKGGSLLVVAEALKPEEGLHWQIAILGLILGSLKARFIFNRNCQNNLDRISRLAQPRIWQFFSSRFLVALMVMILVGSTLSSMAHNSFPILIGVALLDISIGIALLGSSYVFWKQ